MQVLAGLAGCGDDKLEEKKQIPDVARQFYARFDLSPEDGANGSPSWSPDGERIAFYSDRDGSAEIYVMNADGSGVERLTHTEANEGAPAWSPDGKLIAFDSKRDGNYEIYVMNADGSEQRRITDYPERDLAPAWSPDGSKIAYNSYRNESFELHVMNADGSENSKVADSGWIPAWSPDGSRIAYNHGNEIYVVSSDRYNPEPEQVSRNTGSYANWLPDGAHILFQSRTSGRQNFHVMDANGENERMITRVQQGMLQDPRISRDGSHIVYVHLPAQLAVPAGVSGPQVICVMRADGSNSRALTNRQ